NQILADFNEAARNTIMIGDSLKKDGMVAYHVGMPYGWARQGIIDQPPEYRRMMEEHFVAPADRPGPKAKQPLPPMIGKHGFVSWKQVLDHLGQKHLSVTPAVLNLSVHTEAASSEE
ncbi:MAG: hypothetical protein ACRD3W_00315, partial [Terriglobales bacterium]